LPLLTLKGEKNRRKKGRRRQNKEKERRLFFDTKKPSLEREREKKHYQKIDKYKRKYRGNISFGNFSRDFTDGNIPSVYTE
jgi:hypothetical protein